MEDGSLIAAIGGVIALYLGLSITMFFEVIMPFYQTFRKKWKSLQKNLSRPFKYALPKRYKVLSQWYFPKWQLS